MRSRGEGLFAMWLATHLRSQVLNNPAGWEECAREHCDLGTIPYRRFFKRLFIIANGGWQVQVLPKIRTQVRERPSRKKALPEARGFRASVMIRGRIQECRDFLQITRGKRTVVV